MTHPSNTESSTPTAQDRVAKELVVEVGPVAHGGHFVARHEGRVIFVRHGIPGRRSGSG